MPAAIEAVDSPVPQQHSHAFGALREAVLDAYLLNRPAQVPGAALELLRPWAEEVIDSAHGSLRGLNVDGLDESLFASLRWAGVPFSLEGPLQWGTDIIVDDVERPHVNDTQLVLPNPEALSGMTSLAIRPVRHFIGKHFGIRLQAATGISCYFWSNQAIIISRAVVRAGGFLHGPAVGQRASIAIDPGDAQTFSWLE